MRGMGRTRKNGEGNVEGKVDGVKYKKKQSGFRTITLRLLYRYLWWIRIVQYHLPNILYFIFRLCPICELGCGPTNHRASNENQHTYQQVGKRNMSSK